VYGYYVVIVYDIDFGLVYVLLVCDVLYGLCDLFDEFKGDYELYWWFDWLVEVFGVMVDDVFLVWCDCGFCMFLWVVVCMWVWFGECWVIVD